MTSLREKSESVAPEVKRCIYEPLLMKASLVFTSILIMGRVLLWCSKGRSRLALRADSREDKIAGTEGGERGMGWTKGTGGGHTSG